LEKITAEHERAFLRHRARHRRCPKPGDPIALEDMTRWIRAKAFVTRRASDPAEESEAQGLMQEYSSYLQQERGLAAATIRQHLWWVRRFLNSFYKANQVRLASLRAEQIADFVRRHAPRDRTFSAAKNMTTALRSFLRFARYRAYIETDLAAAVPAVAGWSMASIPRAMPLKYVRRVLEESKRRHTSVGLRDRAILLLLARLGLRAREIVLLELDDIDWTRACLRIHGKGRQERPLPLPFDVGQAVTAYLKNGRPTSSCRRVFLRTRAPVRGLNNSSAICQIIRRALKRARIESATKGSHQFRHALATDMLRQGLSLTEIGQLLRHRSPNATSKIR
jgi:integrase/recombinase XerD